MACSTFGILDGYELEVLKPPSLPTTEHQIICLENTNMRGSAMLITQPLGIPAEVYEAQGVITYFDSHAPELQAKIDIMQATLNIITDQRNNAIIIINRFQNTRSHIASIPRELIHYIFELATHTHSILGYNPSQCAKAALRLGSVCTFFRDITQIQSLLLLVRRPIYPLLVRVC